MIESIFFNPWIWIVPIILLAFIVLIVLDIFIWQEGIFATIAGMLLLILGGLYFALILPPYDASFYQTYRITGEVTTLERAFNADEGGGMSQTFVVEVEGVDLLIQSTDQRFRTVDVGDDVNLTCGKSFEYFVEPWYQCSIASTR